MLKIILYIFGFTLFIGASNCSKSNKCYYDTPPNSLFFLLKKGGDRLPDATLTNLKISYIEDGEKKFLPDLIRGVNEGGVDAFTMGIMTTRLIGILSADNNIKDFVIEYADGSRDSLFVNYEGPSTNTNCFYVIKQVKYNNQVSLPDPTITLQTVYLFIKP